MEFVIREMVRFALASSEPGGNLFVTRARTPCKETSSWRLGVVDLVHMLATYCYHLALPQNTAGKNPNSVQEEAGQALGRFE